MWTRFKRVRLCHPALRAQPRSQGNRLFSPIGPGLGRKCKLSLWFGSSSAQSLVQGWESEAGEWWHELFISALEFDYQFLLVKIVSNLSWEWRVRVTVALSELNHSSHNGLHLLTPTKIEPKLNQRSGK